MKRFTRNFWKKPRKIFEGCNKFTNLVKQTNKKPQPVGIDWGQVRKGEREKGKFSL